MRRGARLEPDSGDEPALPVARVRASRGVRMLARLRHGLRRLAEAIGKVPASYVVVTLVLGACLASCAYVLRVWVSALELR